MIHYDYMLINTTRFSKNDIVFVASNSLAYAKTNSR